MVLAPDILYRERQEMYYNLFRFRAKTEYIGSVDIIQWNKVVHKSQSTEVNYYIWGSTGPR